MTSPTRIAFLQDGTEPTAWTHASGAALAILQQVGGSGVEIVLLTHSQHQLKGTSLASALGGPAVKVLLKGDTVTFGSTTLRHATLRTLSRIRRNAVVMAYYADDAMLDEVDGISGLAGVVAMPDLPDTISGWVERWNPIVPGKAQAPTAPLLDTIFENALTSLSGLVNLSHGIMNPRDKGYADETLRILRAKGHVADSEKVTSWAIRNGWKPGAAKELGALAGRIGALKSEPSLSGFHNPEGKYEGWK